MSSCRWFGRANGATESSAPYGAAHPAGKGARALRQVAGLIALFGFFSVALPAHAEPIRLVAFGDSLTAGLGLPGNQAFPARLQAALKAKGHDVLIENAGVSGDTTTAGLSRLDWSIPQGTDGVILELGANDALRGLDPAITEKSLDSILGRLKARNIPVLVTGMLAPPNLGAGYKARFDPIFPRLAQKYGVALYPFFLDGVAGQTKLNQADGVHPSAVGVDVIVGKILPAVEAFIGTLKTAKAG